MVSYFEIDFNKTRDKKNTRIDVKNKGLSNLMVGF